MPAAFVGNQNKYVPAGVLVTLIAASSSTILRGCGGQKQLIESDKTSIPKSHLQNSGKAKKKKEEAEVGEEKKMTKMMIMKKSKRKACALT